jgi:hypothetical protein
LDLVADRAVEGECVGVGPLGLVFPNKSGHKQFIEILVIFGVVEKKDGGVVANVGGIKEG